MTNTFLEFKFIKLQILYPEPSLKHIIIVCVKQCKSMYNYVKIRSNIYLAPSYGISNNNSVGLNEVYCSYFYNREVSIKNRLLNQWLFYFYVHHNKINIAPVYTLIRASCSCIFCDGIFMVT